MTTARFFCALARDLVVLWVDAELLAGPRLAAANVERSWDVL